MRNFGRSMLKVGVTLAAAATLLVAPATAGAMPQIPGSTTKDGLIWLPIYGEGSVQAIDPVTRKVVVTIPGVADHPLVVRATPDGKRLFVNSFGPLVWTMNVIDVPSRRVIKTVTTAGAPYAVTQMSHDGRYLYMPTQLSLVQVMDTQTLDIVRTLPVLLPPGAAHMEITNDDQSIIVLAAPGTATQYNAFTGALEKPPIFLDGFVPGWGETSMDGNTVYGVNFYSGVTAVNTKGWYVERVIPDGSLAAPISATLTPDGKQMWVCNFGDNSLVILDPHTGQIIKRIVNPDGTPVYAGFSSDGKTAYVSNLGGNAAQFPALLHPFKLAYAFFSAPLGVHSTLDFYDTATLTRTGQLPVGAAPIAGAYP
ncbi:hypothetical protein [Antrihabitans cavernicola]|uniref:YncE family protein n=1 Tax=Antrihabitans cavernicola TaxID=2495913 RepID=A0A5A7S637_9NOCA|nr:hypothetical protein [Spelaeibacter cavernicola]KAA0021346.1 hypothetical protein FOY51_19045 [Spelaeibacter cavernicola]